MKSGWWVLLILLGMSPRVVAEDSALTPRFIQTRVFHLPFQQLVEQSPKTKYLLWMSHHDLPWVKVATATAEDRHFRVKVPHDGTFDYAVQVVTPEKTYPKISELRASMRVRVDTHAPSIVMEFRHSAPSKAMVMWEARDDSDGPLKVTLQCRYLGQSEWSEIPQKFNASDSFAWTGVQRPMEARTLVRDAAGNSAKSNVVLVKPNPQEEAPPGKRDPLLDREDRDGLPFMPPPPLDRDESPLPPPALPRTPTSLIPPPDPLYSSTPANHSSKPMR
ncbi:hypothetical protein [Tuwongella immobilis]|uniref:Uncharacterized protein n=1 Tax=Tuwongella immobilis TaxID=692036 RepID=A0A6C2YJR8_9BACT|nr:hypothetical protein [Tuwongella immobilis]VIP01614.1 Uncharacterized protein OS=Singulisphaera acidiphila (strain ATCC BAA-1392 / DSM 18658 / VKM B-2454 / MOB10) GN=Sinac_1083 PE=4 SV=1 [Tuwongella immobilis]VTR98931.1 Uncharacterized protein OS=Singulisphaera acidiphila (strain ATCC BAA-1392 / DSM 18658 / VKM B-2454 / MOB10) GN=Sinac_1083 PE=4 SV=1 [Tuwongella immobilis]